MRDHLFIAIYRCASASDWPLLETDQGFFELRLGGIRRTHETGDAQYRMFGAAEDMRIMRAMSNDFDVLLELEDGSCLVHSQTFVYGDGQFDFEVRHVDPKEYQEVREEWFAESPHREIHPF